MMISSIVINNVWLTNLLVFCNGNGQTAPAFVCERANSVTVAAQEGFCMTKTGLAWLARAGAQKQLNSNNSLYRLSQNSPISWQKHFKLPYRFPLPGLEEKHPCSTRQRRQRHGRLYTD